MEEAKLQLAIAVQNSLEPWILLLLKVKRENIILSIYYEIFLGYTFNIEDPTKYCDTLMTSSPLTSLSYSPKEPHVLAGGCYSGQVSWWDVRTGPQPVASVSVENSHTEPVYKTIWTASKSGSEIMTGGSDGLVKWWDIRNFEKSKEELIVDVENKDLKSSGINTHLTFIAHDMKI